jgi:phosphate transport system permease protein
MSNDIDLTAMADQDFTRPNLQRQMWEGRAVKNNILTILTWIVAILAALPLISVIFMLLMRGGTRLFGADFVEVLTALPPAGFEMGGGIGPAIVGTLTMVAIATVISVPFGIMAAIYLAILGPTSKLATTSRFLAKVLTGFPSILAGVFVYAVLVANFGYSPWAGGVALAVLMLPTVVLAAEESIKQDRSV